MKKILPIATLAILAVQQPSHALFGIGVSYGRNLSSIGSANASLTGGDIPAVLGGFAQDQGLGVPTLNLTRTAIDGLTQLGVKTWLDLPLIPVEFEGGANLAYGTYISDLTLTDGTNSVKVPTSLDLPMGLGSGKTPYSTLALDVSIRYPFLTLPPLSPLKPLKFYAGGGVSWFYGTRLIDKSDISKVFSGDATGTIDQAALQTKLNNNLYSTAFGGHLLLGAQFKVPVLPLAFFVDGKWYLNAATSDAAPKYPLAVSAGLGLAI